MNSLRSVTRRAVPAAFLLFAAVLLVVSPAEGSPTRTDARSSLAPSSSRELAPLELPSLAALDLAAPADASPRFGFAEDLSLLDVEARPSGFVVFAAEAAQCELTYAGNNPIRFTDPTGMMADEADGGSDTERNPCNDDPVPCGGEIARHDDVTVTADAPTARDAVQEGVQTAAPVVEALGTGTVILTAAPAVGLLAPAGAMTTIGVSLYPNAEVITGGVIVSRWGQEGLQAGDWVMKGSANYWNYIRSFKWQPGAGNTKAAFDTGKEYSRYGQSIRWPTGWGIDGWWKGLYGQRRFVPPPR